MDELITGWLDLGISGATVIETTGALQLISQHIPIFAGLRSLTSGGGRHNKTIFTAIKIKRCWIPQFPLLKNCAGIPENPIKGSISSCLCRNSAGWEIIIDGFAKSPNSLPSESEFL
ncbi:MAG: hypothetical protein R2860_17465 [Desulfobacterales bacterium]